jgi:thioredoxin 1
MVAPVIEELAREYGGKVLFGKLNVDENSATSTQYKVLSIPTLLVFSQGKLVDTIVGALPKQVLKSRITLHLD